MEPSALRPSKPSLLERALARCPGQCLVCRSWSRQRVCQLCLDRYARPALRCTSCGLRLPAASLGGIQYASPQCGRCLQQPPPLDRCIAALDYAFPWDHLLLRYKFQQALHLGGALLQCLEAALDREQAQAPDLLLPVPLSAERLRERGYNQSLELARPLARRRGLNCEAKLVLRLRDTAHQLKLPAEQRAANVRHAFALEPQQAGRLRGAHVALLDDVMTTGATLHELARLLRRAGAARIQAWVLARTAE